MSGGANSTKIYRRKFRFQKSFRRVELRETLTFRMNQGVVTTIHDSLSEHDLTPERWTWIKNVGVEACRVVAFGAKTGDETLIFSQRLLTSSPTIISRDDARPNRPVQNLA
jgi:hypothetical protein